MTVARTGLRHPKQKAMYNAAEGVEGEAPTIVLLPFLSSALAEEMTSTDEVCYLGAAARHFMHEITTEEYFDLVLNHLREGAVRHTFDTKDTVRKEDLVFADIICAAVRSTMLDPAVPSLDDQGKPRIARTYSPAPTIKWRPLWKLSG